MGRFSMPDISTVGIVPVPKKLAFGIIAESFAKTCHSVLVPSCRAIDLGEPPQGGVVYTVVNGIHTPSNRPWRTAPGGCGIHRRKRYSYAGGEGGVSEVSECDVSYLALLR